MKAGVCGREGDGISCSNHNTLLQPTSLINLGEVLGEVSLAHPLRELLPTQTTAVGSGNLKTSLQLASNCQDLINSRSIPSFCVYFQLGNSRRDKPLTVAQDPCFPSAAPSYPCQQLPIKAALTCVFFPPVAFPIHFFLPLSSAKLTGQSPAAFPQ